jgi:23S rRNA pseudouridine1911/1915/1917 synthase
MNTSGVLLIGKNAHAQSEFARQSEAGHIRKMYLAMLDGAPERDAGNIDLPIALESEGALRRTVRKDGAPSRTFYRVLERYGSGTCLALISITTGRTHQIRVHMAHIGCPVLGDELYGRRAPGGIIVRQALHAAVLRLMHPQTRTEITIQAPLPDDMLECIQNCK